MTAAPRSRALAAISPFSAVSVWLVALVPLAGLVAPAAAESRDLYSVYRAVIRSCSYSYSGQSPCADMESQEPGEGGTLEPVYFRTTSDCMLWLERRLRAYSSTPAAIRCDLRSYEDGMRIERMF